MFQAFYQWFYNLGRKFQAAMLLVVSVALLLVFQNCAGNFQSTGSSEEASTYGGDPQLMSAPMPVKFNINQIAYMSCPLAGKNTPAADHLMNPFFTLRFGAYDNSVLENKTSGLTSDQMKGGVGISDDAWKYILSRTNAPNGDFVGKFISDSPYTANKRLVMSLINRYRQKDLFTQVFYAVPMLEILSSSIVKSYMMSATDFSNGTSEKVSFFSQAAMLNRSMSASIFFGARESDAAQFRRDLDTTMYMHLGLVDGAFVGNPVDAQLVDTNLVSPDADPTKRLMGRSYQTTFRTSMGQAPTLRVDRGWEGPATLVGVTEYDLNPTTATADPINISLRDNQQWASMTLMIVRDVDRKFYKVGTAYVPKASIESTPNKNEFLFTDMTQLTTVENALAGLNPPTPKGVHFPCPPMNITDLEAQTTAGAELRDKLRIVRRFLPADLWEVNVHPNFMCAVPLPKATSMNYSCHLSGDVSPAKYINYQWNLGFNATCGVEANNNECPAVVSIFYRKQ